MNESVRDNIIFGKEYDAALYAQCIQNACLEQDLRILPHGD
jgi:hypothetical protein